MSKPEAVARPTGLELRPHGPVELRVDGDPALLGGVKQRAVLAMLSLR